MGKTVSGAQQAAGDPQFRFNFRFHLGIPSLYAVLYCTRLLVFHYFLRFVVCVNDGSAHVKAQFKASLIEMLVPDVSNAKREGETRILRLYLRTNETLILSSKLSDLQLVVHTNTLRSLALSLHIG